MELSVAKSLIEKGVDASVPDQVWADLGAGDGMFTKALADLLPEKSKIIAIDKDAGSLKRISSSLADIEIQTLIADLNNLPAQLQQFDGIVMANSLHYIKNQEEFISKLKSTFLKTSAVLILVEYNLEKSNMWVPYPVSKNRLVLLAHASGFELEFSTHSVKSRLNASEIYSAVLKPKA